MVFVGVWLCEFGSICVLLLSVSVSMCVCVCVGATLWQLCDNQGGCSIAIYSVCVCVCVCVLGGVHYTSKVEGNLTL